MRFDALVTEGLRRRMVEIARDLRMESTPSETVLWERLRARKLDGRKFRRQQPIGAFVVDFYCDEAALVVEVDGPIHEHQRAADRERQQVLEDLGLRVFRLSAASVEDDIDGAVSAIRLQLSPSPPLPSGEGRG